MNLDNFFLIFFHFLIIISSVITFLLRLKKNPQSFYLNYLFYLLFLSLFYISLPCIESLFLNYSPVGASKNTIFVTSLIGLYFNFVFFFSYLFSKDKLVNLHSFKLKKIKNINGIVKIISFLIFCFVIFLIFTKYQMIINVWGFRGRQAVLSNFLETQFKIKPLFNLQVLLVSFLLLQEKKLKYIYVFLPFLVYDLMLSGRMYLLAILVLIFIYSVLINKVIKKKYLFGSVLMMGLIGIFRHGDFSILRLFLLFKEMTYTWSSSHLMYESVLSQDFFTSLNYSLFRVFPSSVYDYFFGEYVSYTKITGDSNPLGWGLAGSIVAEAISFKNTLVLLIYPFIIVFYGNIMNIFLRLNYLSGIIIFIIAVLYIQPMLRFSFFEFALYPFYMILFFGFFIVICDLERMKFNIKKT
jgi:hypothetical protein